MREGERADGVTWWRSGVLYQIYPRSFADSNGDGNGDLQGVIDHLDHLAWLGVDGIWLNPITPSPNADWGYDVADYTSVDPDFGDLHILDRLVAEAGARGIRVLLDLVPNHTSDQHPWFVESRASRDSAHRDWYVWADAKADGSPPNNWLSVFGGPAWSWDEPTQQFYLHNFLAEQPDLNWWNEEVRQAFDDISRFWFNLGIAGFRIDVAHALVKDRDLRDNPAAEESDHPGVRALGQRSVYNMNRPEVHDVFRRWRKIADSYDPPAVLLGETWVLDIESLVSYYGGGSDELHLALNVPFILAELGTEMRTIVEGVEATLPAGAWPAWNGSNHDAGRFPSRWCGDDVRKVRAALVVLLGLRGTPILYYGDEIGMPQVAVPHARLRDPVGLRGWPDEPGRDGARTPMHWTHAPAGAFTDPGVEPWLPTGDPASCNVANQREDAGSVLCLCRDLIALRRARPDLNSGKYATVGSPEGVWAWARGDRTVVAVNCSERPAEVELGADEVLIGTRRERDGDRVLGPVQLAPWEAIVLSRPVAG
ncbi:MAG TPA: alpha-amylase family glycosyl hydrolase [Actinomycetota bacterium]|nr:alpha-amylase family glycosyl hydrolase [Actinomycetota bacterium]